MKIAVCMKQVPAVSDGNMDPQSGRLIRTGVEAVTNVYDLAALEAALRIREQTGGEIHVFTMGPEKAEEVIRKAYAMGADKGYLICDQAFAGADVLATSHTLMQAINCAGDFDLILCGRQTTDGDTAQVSGALAQWMKIPHVNWVDKIDIESENKCRIIYKMENRRVEAEIGCPCVLAVEREHYTPRMPSLKLKMLGKKKDITRISCADFVDSDPQKYGIFGSATKVKKIFPPELTSQKEVIFAQGDKGAIYVKTILDAYLQEVRNGD